MDEAPHPIVYPLRGVKTFCSHAELWRSSLVPMLITLVVSVLSVVLLFLFAFNVQKELYSDVLPEWLGSVMAVVMIGMEVLVIVFVCVHFLFAKYKSELYVKVFDMEGVPKEEHELSTAEVAGLCCMQQAISLGLLVITLPLNVVPVVGTVVFCAINGPVLAWGLQDGFMLDKGMRLSEQLSFVRAHFLAYLAFGALAMLLILMPFVNVFFIFSNVVGAALWAVEQERSGEVDRFLLDEFNQAAMTDFSGASLVVDGEANLSAFA